MAPGVPLVYIPNGDENRKTAPQPRTKFTADVELAFLRLIIEDRRLTAEDVRVARHLLELCVVSENGHASPRVPELASVARMLSAAVVRSLNRLTNDWSGYFWRAGRDGTRGARYVPRIEKLGRP